MNADPIKSALRMMPYGFYSVTSRSGDEVNAMVANWIMQVSFEPRLVVLALAKKAHSHQLITEGGVFGINIFTEANQDAIMPFTKSTEKNPDKMKGAGYTEGPETSVPLLEGAAAYLECRVAQVLDTGGDHSLIVAEPVGGQVIEEVKPSEVLSLPDLGWSYAG